MAENPAKIEVRFNIPAHYPHGIERKMNGGRSSQPARQDYFTISKVNDMVAATLSSPGAIGVDFSDASIARKTMGRG